MKLILTSFLLFFIFTSSLFSQSKISGTVFDNTKKEILIGATVQIKGANGTRTNQNGKYSLDIPSGNQEVEIKYLGFETQTIAVNLKPNEEKIIDILLIPKANDIHQVTISGSRFEKRAAEEIVSIEVVKPKTILNSGLNSMDDALNRVPGVDVIENQVNIRGGAGWSYGAGSRVLVLVDDMPMLTADAGDAKLDFLPLENCEQIEVLKGAASSLYGSSALNGVVNFRTGYAGLKPKTKVMLYNGMFGNPEDKSWIWWGKKQPQFQGGYFSHSRKINNLDVVFGSAWFSEDSYLQGDLSRRARANLNLRYRDKKIDGLIYGINLNGQLSKTQTFFFWQPDTIQNYFYLPYGGLADSTTTINKNQGQRFNVDPYIIYNGKKGSKHSLRSRWFRSNNQIPEKMQSSIADLYYIDYQFSKAIESENKFLNQINFVGGATVNFQNVVGELYGNHSGNNKAAYVQLEKKIGKLWTSVGARYEQNVVDTFKPEARPVFRFGANYEITKATFLRASFGQGYRYPSIAERFVKTKFGASQVFPNPNLKSETGWSSELGLKQFMKSGNWQGVIDVAYFWMEYKDMMEFNFGFHAPNDSTVAQVGPRVIDYIGFQSKNIGRARINGIDISTSGQIEFSKLKWRYMLGYTYMNPMQINPDSAIVVNISGPTNTLKYRYRNSLKFDTEFGYKKATFGFTTLYTSFMQNIDAVFENTKPENNFGQIFEFSTKLPTTIHQFREKYNNGTLVFDARFSYQITNNVKMAFIVRNLSNTVYAERPALLSPPRNFTLQMALDM